IDLIDVHHLSRTEFDEGQFLRAQTCFASETRQQIAPVLGQCLPASRPPFNLHRFGPVSAPYQLRRPMFRVLRRRLFLGFAAGVFVGSASVMLVAPWWQWLRTPGNEAAFSREAN